MHWKESEVTAEEYRRIWGTDANVQYLDYSGGLIGYTFMKQSKHRCISLHSNWTSIKLVFKRIWEKNKY